MTAGGAGAHGRAAGGERRPIRVLLADDATQLRHILRRMLELDGFEVVADVGTGGEAAALVAGGIAVDVVVLDDRMPDLGGIDTARRILDGRPDQVVVLYTAFPHHDLEAAARDAGVAAVLGKADGIESLEREITRVAGEPG